MRAPDGRAIVEVTGIRTDAVLTAEVDPGKLPGLSVTAEPGDRDFRPSGDEVLRAPIDLTD